MATMADLLDAIKQVESGGNNRARSSKGAMGAYQFMPATAREFGLKDPYNEQEARGAAERKITGLLAEFDGDLPKAIAAYNLGQGNLRKLGGNYNRVPETRGYVSKVLNALNPISTANANEQPDDWQDAPAQASSEDPGDWQDETPAATPSKEDTSKFTTKPEYANDPFAKTAEWMANHGILGGRDIQPKELADELSKPESIDKMLTSAAVNTIPSSVLNSALKRVAFGSAVGASGGNTPQEMANGALMGAGLGIAGEAVPTLSRIINTGKRAIIDPIKNPEQVAGSLLRRMAEDPENPRVLEATTAALEQPKTLIRGSMPTTPEASGNGGMWALYKSIMAREPAADRAILDAKNIARLKAIKELGVGDSAAAVGTRLKGEAVQDLGKAEDSLANTPIDLQTVRDEITTLLDSGAAKTPQIKKTLASLLGNLYKSKSQTEGERVLESALEQVQGIRTAANRAVYGENGIKVAGPIGEQLSGISGQVIGKIDDAIEQALSESGNSGLHASFKAKYAKGSTIEQRAKTLQDILTKGSSPGELPVIHEVAPGSFGATGERMPSDILSVKLSNLMRGNSPTMRNAKRLLTPGQMQRLADLDADIRRSIPKDVKRGSDTFQNAAADYIAAGMLGEEGAGNTLSGSVIRGVGSATNKVLPEFVRKAFPSASPTENEAIRKILVRAMREPKYAASLIRNYKQSGIVTTDIPSRFGPSLVEVLEGNGKRYSVPEDKSRRY